MRKIITFLTETFFHFANLLNVAVILVRSINFSQTAVIASSKIEIYFYHKKWYFWVKSRYFIRKRDMPVLSNHFRGLCRYTHFKFLFLKKSCWFSRHFFWKTPERTYYIGLQRPILHDDNESCTLLFSEGKQSKSCRFEV